VALEEELCAAVADAEGEIVALLQELVRRPSLPGEEGEAQEAVADALRALDLEVDVLPCRFDDVRHHPAFVDDGYAPDGRVDVLGRWPGTGRGGGRSLVLNGHIDVVPEGDPARWSRSPWSGDVVDGAVHGRGACDMKAGIAAAVGALAAARRVGIRPAGDVLVQSVVGEETGGLGTLAAIVHSHTADAALILEPTSLDACPVQSGALTFRIAVPGLAAHGATRHDGVSALDKLRVVLDALDRLEAERRAERTAPISVGTVHGGVWPSSVPEEVVVEGRYGVLPGEDVATARRAFEAAVGAAAAADGWLAGHPPAVAWVEGQFESGATPRDDPFVAAVSSAHRAVAGAEPVVRGVPYGSDLRLFTNHAGMPAVLYGPGDARWAHAVDERVPIAEVVAAARTVAVLVARWCGA
jgi:acetylornithine deacetylase